jgi:hypothetical protein
MKKICTLLILILSVLEISAQVNGYAKVTLIVGPVLTVSNANETYDAFAIGESVIVMQMQDNVIGSNTANNSGFGNLAAIASAGRYEVGTISGVTRVLGAPTVITLTTSLTNTYNTGSNSSVQIITFPRLAAGNYTTTANITAVSWNGLVGGVVAFRVGGILTLSHNITADAQGFRGAAADASSTPYGSCNSTTWTSATDVLLGNKGEGIYKVTGAGYVSGKGKILNGGGGGNTINAGGGGGGNYTAGGDGSAGWSCGAGTGGVGGIALSTYFSAGDRLFMGGGGGSGEANDGSNDRGGNGGGIIIIKAGTIRTTGTGTARRISANGETAPAVANDGGGGAGAGGSIALLVTNYTVVAGRPLIISANGGDGGDVADPSPHGGGAGGGQGAVLFASVRPTTNITTTTNNGQGGLNNAGGTRGNGGQGTSSSGIIPTAINILPLKLVSFTAAKTNNNVQLNWKTENEENVSRYEVQRSTNGTVYETIGTVTAANNSTTAQTYSFADPRSVSSVTYYRLRMVDIDGQFTYSNVLILRAANGTATGVSVYPNPARANASLYITSAVNGNAAIRVINMQGATVYTQQSLVSKGDNIVPVSRMQSLSNGVYNVQVTINNETYHTRLIVQK